MKNSLFFVGAFIIVVVVFFFPVIFGRLPIPSDTIIGLYHPFRDLYAKDYPNGIPYKNFLITDPVRQQYPWRELAISEEKKSQIPLWNPYSGLGTPLAGNIQSSPWYPLNILFFILPFEYAWSILVIVQPLFAGLFLYIYLVHMRINKFGSLLGAVTFAFCGFSVAWLEWNTIVHVALWLPLILLAKEHLLKKISLAWIFVLLFAEISQFLAGHIQVLFYSLIVSNIYLVSRIIQKIIQEKKSGNLITESIRTYFPFLLIGFMLIAVTAIQWIPALRFIQESARNVDQSEWSKPGWFIPWQNLVQFVAPDFFGNPTTLNYWGVWNYGEFIGYVGIIQLIFAILALFFRRDKKTFFFGTFFFLSLIFSLPTIFAKIPYILNLPFISTSQPTRLLFITDFSLAVLSALGFDWFTKRKHGAYYPLIFIGILLLGLWTFVLLSSKITANIPFSNVDVASRNLIFPTIILVAFIICSFFLQRVAKKNITIMICIIIIGIAIFDLLRFGLKFTPFTEKQYLFPKTQSLSFLQENIGNYRLMTTDSRILPPNFSVVYRLQSVDLYDPLYLKRYAEFIAASERGKPDISEPFGFNRIITPHNFESKLIDLMGVKYVLSLTDLSSPKLKKVFQERQTRVYENKNVLPRSFFVKSLKLVTSKEEAIKTMFAENFDCRYSAVFESLGPGYNTPLFDGELSTGSANIVLYSQNRIVIETEIAKEGFLVITDSFYPTWKARIYLDQKEAPIDSPLSISLREKGTAVFRADYNFRGVIVPKGKNLVEFFNIL